ncbi:hypothetical protein MG293_013291 [Ovis ammon polii]|uniref:Uncharacterized protein n=1 Tax=Ovis ammon polii TaxID=230172 RepID=A0AAD4Y7C8_OVIAM|nr:hypothetical protein MG293_013291 [Ovis ammon polii]
MLLTHNELSHKLSDVVPQEDLVEELPQGCAEEEPLSILKVAFSICETDCFLESFSSSDTDDNADSPHGSCPQTPEKCMEYNKDSETEVISPFIFFKVFLFFRSIDSSL